MFVVGYTAGGFPYGVTETEMDSSGGEAGEDVSGDFADSGYHDLERAEADPLADLGALWTARGPEELWRALVLSPGRRTTHHWEAVSLFRHHHEDGTPGALTTALLLCTDRRWDRGGARLIAGIADTAILGADDLLEFASPFLWSDRFRFQCPVEWFDTEGVGVDLDGEYETGEGSVVADPDTPVSAARSIAPPSRRWAAAHVLRNDPGTFDTIRARALELESRGAAAVVSGMLDAIETLDEEIVREAIALGLGWPRGSVRLLALDLLAVRDPEAARERAAADPDKKVRGWSPRRPRGGIAPAPKTDRRPKAEERSHSGPGTAQAALFPE